jgi:hypothetical protein
VRRKLRGACNGYAFLSGFGRFVRAMCSIFDRLAITQPSN